MTVQIIKNNGQPEYAVVPIADYEELLKKAEMLDDVAAYDRAKAELANGEDELVPAELADAILDGKNPVKIWRQYRELSQVELSGRIGKSQAYLAQIENGKREGTIAVYRAIAQALNVDLDDIVGP
ncbi:MAG: helix-turn-helix transcriptional regulator [Sedimenticolaceae bacterium]|jgi:DNA-binding XRE family transcriptional regulator